MLSPFFRKRLFLGLVLLSGLLLILGACGSPGTAAESPNDTGDGSPEQNGSEPAPVAFQVEDIHFQQLDELQSQPAGAYWVTVDENTYLVVTAGEKPTAGYAIDVETVTYDGTELKVHAQLHEPKPGEVVAQVITYPMVVLSILDESLHHVPATVEWTS